jgi:hypothetical protein
MQRGKDESAREIVDVEVGSGKEVVSGREVAEA